MTFAHDTETALQDAVDLVNTQAGLGADEDTLMTTGDLEDFLADHPWTGSRTHDDAELAAVRRLRRRVQGLWGSGEDETVEVVNALLRDGKALPQLVRHDDFPWHLHATGDEQPLATRMAVEAAMAVVDVIRAGELARLRVCDRDGCEAVLVDLSRNRSRRYCDYGCGNRVAVAAYRARQSDPELGDPEQSDHEPSEGTS